MITFIRETERCSCAAARRKSNRPRTPAPRRGENRRLALTGRARRRMRKRVAPAATDAALLGQPSECGEHEGEVLQWKMGIARGESEIRCESVTGCLTKRAQKDYGLVVGSRLKRERS
ncbi:hypothetical protein EVAR_57651_1 [Eumeta japonica]|uniref:Uncharacterized protein n=1 Tax=Eumeta variegata TaxID=151549 RepID=A0A4C1ZDB3_EUMVA|nr:hypothetical protein EVAR_57651_1 [Eumeta japonica]